LPPFARNSEMILLFQSSGTGYSYLSR